MDSEQYGQTSFDIGKRMADEAGPEFAKAVIALAQRFLEVEDEIRRLAAEEVAAGIADPISDSDLREINQQSFLRMAFEFLNAHSLTVVERLYPPQSQRK